MNEDIYEVIKQQEEAQEAAPAQVENRDVGENGLREFTDEEKADYAARKKAERDGLYARIDKVTARIVEDPGALRDYLDVMARFPRYSVANTLLIFDQLPEAERIGDFDSWKRRGAAVKQGEKAICILEPGDEYTRADGSIGVSYNVKKVFDERQTSARHLEPRHPDMRQLLFALIDKSPVGVKTAEELPGGVAALYDHEAGMVSVAKGFDGEQLFRALATELAQATLAEQDSFYDHGANADTAAIAAYVIASRYGVSNLGQVPVLADAAPETPPAEVRAELSRVRDVAKAVSDRVDKTLQVARQQDGGQKPKQASWGDRDAR
jgi:hypothetical protein